MADGIALVAPNADFSGAPVGFVNINPPPTLPTGCHTLLLTRKNRTVMRRNRIDGEEIALTEMPGDGGAWVYEDTYIAHTQRTTGWMAPDWDQTYSTGFTYAVVTRLLTSGTSKVVLSSGDYTSVTPIRGWRLTAQTGDLTFRIANLDGTAGVDDQYAPNAPGAQPTGWFMVFITYDPAVGTYGTAYVHYPHSSRRNPSTLLAASRRAASETAGLAILLDTTPTSEAALNEGLEMIAAWDRALTQAEATDAYTALAVTAESNGSSWLENRGIVVE